LAAAQMVSVPLEAQSADQPKDPSTGYNLPAPAPGAAPRPPAVNWDPPPLNIPDYSFTRGLSARQRAYSRATAAACGRTYMSVEIDRDSFKGQSAAQENLEGYLARVPVSLTNICEDDRTRMYVGKLFSILRVVHDASRKDPLVMGEGYTLTLSYNFASPKPMNQRDLTVALVTGINQLVSQYMARTSYMDPKQGAQKDDDEP